MKRLQRVEDARDVMWLGKLKHLFLRPCRYLPTLSAIVVRRLERCWHMRPAGRASGTTSRKIKGIIRKYYSFCPRHRSRMYWFSSGSNNHNDNWFLSIYILFILIIFEKYSTQSVQRFWREFVKPYQRTYFRIYTFRIYRLKLDNNFRNVSFNYNNCFESYWNKLSLCFFFTKPLKESSPLEIISANNLQWDYRVSSGTDPDIALINNSCPI